MSNGLKSSPIPTSRSEVEGSPPALRDDTLPVVSPPATVEAKKGNVGCRNNCSHPPTSLQERAFICGRWEGTHWVDSVRIVCQLFFYHIWSELLLVIDNQLALSLCFSFFCPSMGSSAKPSSSTGITVVSPPSVASPVASRKVKTAQPMKRLYLLVINRVNTTNSCLSGRNQTIPSPVGYQSSQHNKCMSVR